MGRKGTSFNRREPSLKQQPTVLVICEDSKSSKRYLEDASQSFRVKVQVEITHCGNTDPKGIVNEAINRQNKFDQVYCAIDRDTHENFNEAINLANRTKKVEVIASYPCFEFWLLLHFGYTRKPYNATGKHSAAELLVKDLRQKLGLENYQKGNHQNIFNLLLSQLPQARQHSERILLEAQNSREMNPSTQLHLLIDEFEKLSKPQLI